MNERVNEIVIFGIIEIKIKWKEFVCLYIRKFFGFLFLMSFDLLFVRYFKIFCFVDFFVIIGLG